LERVRCFYNSISILLWNNSYSILLFLFFSDLDHIASKFRNWSNG
jgi:hypothetical protein